MVDRIVKGWRLDCNVWWGKFCYGYGNEYPVEFDVGVHLYRTGRNNASRQHWRDSPSTGEYGAQRLTVSQTTDVPFAGCCGACGERRGATVGGAGLFEFG